MQSFAALAEVRGLAGVQQHTSGDGCYSVVRVCGLNVDVEGGGEAGAMAGVGVGGG